MSEIGQLRASLSANAARFEADMNKAKQAVSKNAKGMETAMDRVSKSFSGTISKINRFGAIAATAAATGIALFIKKQIDIADEMGKLAQQTGTTTEFLSSMGLVASQSGTSLEAIAKAVQRLSMNMADARKGTGEAKDAFADLGIAVADDAGVLRNAQAALLDVADRFSKMEDGADKTALAMRLFGKAGAELIPMFNMGRVGIEQFMKKAEGLGLVIGTQTALEAAYLNDQLDLLTKAAAGTGRSFALDLVPWLVDAVNAMKTAKKESGTLMATWVALGAIGHAVFGKSLQSEIDDTRERLEMITELQRKYEQAPAWQKKTGFFTWDYSEEIAKLKEELAKLGVQQTQADAAEKKRMEESLARAQKLAEEKRGYTEEIRRQAEARMEAARLSAEEEAAEKAKIKEAEAAQKAIEDQVAALEFEARTYGMTTAQITLYRLELAGANAEQLKAAQLALEDIAAKTAQAEAIEEAKNKTAEFETRAKSFYESTRTPQEHYNATIKELDELLAASAIDMEVYSLASQQAWEDMEKAAGKAKDEGKGFIDNLEDAFSGWANNMSSTLNDVLWDADATFGDIATSFGKMITQMIIQTQLIEPLMKGLFGGEGGGGGWLGSLLGGRGGAKSDAGMGIGQIAGGSGGGLIGSIVGLVAGLFHEGGRVGMDPVPMRMVPPSLFAHAPRLHEGLLRDEYPAILKRNESVLTPEQMAAEEGGGKQVIIKGPLMVINTPNADSFRSAKGQITADMAVALQRAQRNL